MQKVVGSNPIIRFQKPLPEGVFLESDVFRTPGDQQLRAVSIA